MLTDASNPSVEGMLMPTIGTLMFLRRPTSSGSMSKEHTMTASTLRRTGMSVKNSCRVCALGMPYSDRSYPAGWNTELRPS